MSRAEQIAAAARDFGVHLLARGRDFVASRDYGNAHQRRADENESRIDPDLLHFSERCHRVYSLEQRPALVADFARLLVQQLDPDQHDGRGVHVHQRADQPDVLDGDGLYRQRRAAGADELAEACLAVAAV